MKNKNLLFSFSLAISLILLCNLNCIQSIKDDSIYSSDDVSYWLDTETNSVHKMITINGKTMVESIIRYDNGTAEEVMEVIRSEVVDGKAVWAYYVPSTGYTVEMKVVSSTGNEITVEWNNKDPEDEVNYGEEVLIRCEEHGNWEIIEDAKPLDDDAKLLPENIDILYIPFAIAQKNQAFAPYVYAYKKIKY